MYSSVLACCSFPDARQPRRTGGRTQPPSRGDAADAPLRAARARPGTPRPCPRTRARAHTRSSTRRARRAPRGRRARSRRASAGRGGLPRLRRFPGTRAGTQGAREARGTRARRLRCPPRGRRARRRRRPLPGGAALGRARRVPQAMPERTGSGRAGSRHPARPTRGQLEKAMPGQHGLDKGRTVSRQSLASWTSSSSPGVANKPGTSSACSARKPTRLCRASGTAERGRGSSPPASGSGSRFSPASSAATTCAIVTRSSRFVSRIGPESRTRCGRRAPKTVGRHERAASERKRSLPRTLRTSRSAISPAEVLTGNESAPEPVAEVTRMVSVMVCRPDGRTRPEVGETVSQGGVRVDVPGLTTNDHGAMACTGGTRSAWQGSSEAQDLRRTDPTLTTSICLDTGSSYRISSKSTDGPGENLTSGSSSLSYWSTAVREGQG